MGLELEQNTVGHLTKAEFTHGISVRVHNKLERINKKSQV